MEVLLSIMNEYISANDAITVPQEPSYKPRHLVLSHLGRCSTAYKKIKTKTNVLCHTLCFLRGYK